MIYLLAGFRGHDGVTGRASELVARRLLRDPAHLRSPPVEVHLAPAQLQFAERHHRQHPLLHELLLGRRLPRHRLPPPATGSGGGIRGDVGDAQEGGRVSSGLLHRHVRALPRAVSREHHSHHQETTTEK